MVVAGVLLGKMSGGSFVAMQFACMGPLALFTGYDLRR